MINIIYLVLSNIIVDLGHASYTHIREFYEGNKTERVKEKKMRKEEDVDGVKEEIKV